VVTKAYNKKTNLGIPICRFSGASPFESNAKKREKKRVLVLQGHLSIGQLINY
jgi:hypothetical protein